MSLVNLLLMEMELEPGIAYVVDIDKPDGTIETKIIEHEEIKKVLS